MRPSELPGNPAEGQPELLCSDVDLSPAEAARQFGGEIARTLGYGGPTGTDVTDHDAGEPADLMGDFAEK